MIKIFLTAALALLPVSGSAQPAALAQLGDLPQAAVPQASAPETVQPAIPGRVKPDGLTGKWLGQGEWTYQGSGAHCYMNLEFVDTQSYLERKGGYFDCGFVGLASEPARFAKKGTQLISEDGQVAGSYENNVITLNEAYSETVGIVTTIKVDGLHFDYNEIWTGSDGKELYVITGRLFTGG